MRIKGDKFVKMSEKRMFGGMKEFVGEDDGNGKNITFIEIFLPFFR